MPDVLATATLNSETNLAEDRFVNNWAFRDVPSLLSGTLALVASELADFYVTQVTGALRPMKDFLSTIVGNNVLAGLTIRLYDITGRLDGSPHGSPVYEQNFTVPAPTGSTYDLPTEVAACITLEALGRDTAAVETPDSGDAGTERDRPKQRRTGRIYFGPLNNLAVETTNNVVRVSNSLRDTARLAVVDLAAGLSAVHPDIDLAVWSRKDAILRQVEAVSIDDAFDTMRSRGEAPSQRERTLL